MQAAEAAAELEAFGDFYAALLAREHYGDHVCLAAQPEDANGSPELLVERGVDETATITGAWAEAIAQAVDDRSTEGSILTALGSLELDIAPFAQVVEREILHGAMLGALDSEWEREHGEELAPVRFAAAELTEGAFSSLPYADAVRLFQERQVLPRPAFDALEAGAKRQAFTVARMASAEMLNVTKAELARVLNLSRQRPELGADGVARRPGVNLQDFRKFAKERLESAGWTPANKSHVETIYRTNVVSAYSSGRFVEMRKPSVLVALPYWQIRGVNDSRARPTHKAAFGIVLPASDPFWLHAYPPFDYNCLLPGTAVRGNFTAASRAKYSGKAIELTTAKGRRLSVTANHPVLTRRGFVRACDLREGDELVSYRDEPGVLPLGERPERHEHNTPATVEEVFGALAQAGGPLLTRAAADDFHGEAKRFRGEVEVVGSFANLARELKPTSGAELPRLALEATDPTHLRASTRGTPLGTILLPSARAPGLPALSFHSAAVGLQRLPFQALRIALPAQLDPVLTEQASEGLTRDAQLVGKLLERGASEVALDQVRSVREFEFCGHVYDLESKTGWLAANGIVVGNCRCRVVARTRRWIEANKVAIGPVPKGLPGPGFESGTSKLISVPSAALAPPPAPVAPPAPTHPPHLHPPLPPPLPAPVAPSLPLPPPILNIDELRRQKLDELSRRARAIDEEAERVWAREAKAAARASSNPTVAKAKAMKSALETANTRARGMVRKQVETSLDVKLPRGTKDRKKRTKLTVASEATMTATQGSGTRAYLDLNTGEVVVRESVRNGAARALDYFDRGLFSDPRLATSTLERGDAFLEKFANARERGVAPDPGGALNDLRTMFHEELHGYSRIGPRVYTGIGRVIEEVGTELNARHIVKNLTPEIAQNPTLARRFGSQAIGGTASYRQEIDIICDVVARHAQVSREAAGELVRQAHVRGLLSGKHTTVGPLEHLHEFVGGLDVSPERAQLIERELQEAHAWFQSHER
jgi:hypothetical protein